MLSKNLIQEPYKIFRLHDFGSRFNGRSGSFAGCGYCLGTYSTIAAIFVKCNNYYHVVQHGCVWRPAAVATRVFERTTRGGERRSGTFIGRYGPLSDVRLFGFTTGRARARAHNAKYARLLPFQITISGATLPRRELFYINSFQNNSDVTRAFVGTSLARSDYSGVGRQTRP